MSGTQGANVYNRHSTKMMHESVADQLVRFHRVLDCVPQDGNCLFESIARQLDGPHTHTSLRHLTVSNGLTNMLKYEELNGEYETRLTRKINELLQDNKWNAEIDNLVLNIIADALGVSIVVLGSYLPPHFFPCDNNDAIDDNTVVLVKDEMQTHFDATIPTIRSGKYLLPISLLGILRIY